MSRQFPLLQAVIPVMKSLLPTLLFLPLSLLSCATPPSKPVSKTAAAPEAPVPLGTHAFLVNREQAKRWPHLEKHIGQLILASESLQIVLSPAPPMPGAQEYFSLIGKVYEKHGSTWWALPWLPSLDIRVRSAAGDALQLIGQDIVQDASGLSVQAFFRQQNKGQADARLHFKLIGDEGRLELKLSGTGVAATLRARRGLGEDRLIPLADGRTAGLTSNLLPHALSVLGAAPLTARQTAEASYLDAEAGHPGFTLLIGRKALLQQTQWLGQHFACPTKKGKTTVPCPLPKSDSWTLSSPASTQGPAHWRSAYLYTRKGSFRGLIVVREGENLEIPLSREPLEILTPNSEGLLETLTFQAKKGAKLTLPPLRKGSLSLKLDPAQAAYVEIRDSVQLRSSSLLSWLPESDRSILTPNTLINARWPLALDLPSGDYSLQVYDADRVLCAHTFTLQASRKQVIDCQPSSPAPSFSPRASISVDREAISDEQLNASKLAVITSSTANEKKPLEIPMLAIYDSELGLSIRAFPSTPELEKAWSTRLKDGPQGVQAFADFVRAADPQLSLVLDCPPPGFQLAEFHWIVQSVKPDVLEVYGCRDPNQTDELLQLAQRYQQKLNRPLRLAAATFTDSLFEAHVPSLFLSNFPSGRLLTLKEALQDLREGRYTLGLRHELLIPAIRRDDHQVTLTIRGESTPGLQLRLFDQDGRLAEQAVKLGTGFEHEVKMNLPLKADSRFLRIELVSKAEDGHTLTLATSQFFGLDAPVSPSE